jgi:hypothetical protein
MPDVFKRFPVHGQAVGAWLDNGLAFTTRYSTPIDPGNFNGTFD